MSNPSRDLQANLRRRMRRLQDLRTGMDPHALRLAGVYEDVEEARCELEPPLPDDEESPNEAPPPGA